MRFKMDLVYLILWLTKTCPSKINCFVRLLLWQRMRSIKDNSYTKLSKLTMWGPLIRATKVGPTYLHNNISFKKTNPDQPQWQGLIPFHSLSLLALPIPKFKLNFLMFQHSFYYVEIRCNSNK